MKVTVESTGALVLVRGAECRVWTGTNEQGREVNLFVACAGLGWFPDGEQPHPAHLEPQVYFGAEELPL